MVIAVIPFEDLEKLVSMAASAALLTTPPRLHSLPGIEKSFAV
jgi:hypothetical protein